MSYTERIYPITNLCARNKDLLNIRMSSDLCEFTPPSFNISGATKIQPVSTSSESVYLLTGQTDTNLGFNFSGGPAPYSGTNTDYIVEIYKYDKSLSAFTTPHIYKSDSISMSGDVVSSSYTMDISFDIIKPDNEYLIKTHFEFDSCTEFLDILGVRYNNRMVSGDIYNLYNNEFDYYMSVSYPADVPQIENSGGLLSSFGGLIAYTKFPTISGQTDFTLQSSIGDVIVNLNGITLAPDYEYSVNDDIVTISGGTKLTDIVTFIHSAGDSDLAGLVYDTINVSTINSGATDTQGSNNVFYNTTEDKYELYTSLEIANNSDVIVTLNGVTLANNIDYYRSISNNQRIILEGEILNGDVINIYYFSNPTYVGSIYTNTPLITWSIENPPSMSNGYFTLEMSTASTFTDITYSSTTDYIINEQIYSDSLIISGNIGTQYYYRVKNEKFYQPITGNTIDTVAYSEIVPIQIQSNAINSY